AERHFDEWQVVYREAMQLERALRGVPQLLASQAPETEEMMKEGRLQEVRADRSLATTPSGELVKQAMASVTELVRTEVELARAEAGEEIRREIGAVKGLGVAGVCALTTLSLVVVAIAMALAQAGLPAWAATLIVAAVVLAVGTVAGLVGWRKRVQKPLERTQRS